MLKDIAWSLRDAGRDAEAEQVFRRALAFDPEDPETQAVLLHLYGNETEREAHDEAVARRWQETTDPQALLDEGTERLAAGDARGALELLRRAAPEHPNLEAAWYNLGIAAYRSKEWPTAEDAYRRAAAINPQRADSHFFRGVALVHLERWAEAVGALSRALALDPARLQAHYHLAVCHERLGDREEAARHRRLYEEGTKRP
jgi:tetratricopeptide (TPR) repeat protein